MIEVRATTEHNGSRLDRFLATELSDYSRSRLQALIRDGFVLLNGKTPRTRETIKSGDLVSVTVPDVVKIANAPEAIALNILFEDDDLVVIDKPAGLVVHPGAGHSEHTLVNALLYHCKTLSGIGGKERPGIVHRLDKETSGCMVVAKNDAAHQHLSAQFAARTVRKIYLVLVAGLLKNSTGMIDAPIARHRVHRQRMAVSQSRGRTAKTAYRVLKRGQEFTMAECVIHSGRTHQIRVHFHHLGHPVLGDKLYGAKNAARYPRQMLHAWKLGFEHPRTGETKNFEAPIPADFADAMESDL
jgi:23S rRNA pseudouridine1911/1915/1917 synthase